MSDKAYQYISLVKNKLCFALKDELYDFALKHNLISAGKYNKDTIIWNIEKSLSQDLALEALNRFSNVIGFTGTEIENLLKISKDERVKWTKKKLLNVTGTYEVRAYGTYLYCPIYDGVQIIDLIEKGVEDIRNSIKQPTEKQLAAIQKARQKAIENRTCKKCGNVVKSKKRLDDAGVCNWCAEKEYIDKCRNEALERRKYWLEHKDQYVILDVETTGLGYHDEVVQIGIMDLDGNILLNQLVKPTQKIPEEAIYIHGITDKMVDTAPTWEEVYKIVVEIIKGKTIIAYNASFDVDMIENSCRKYDIKPDKMGYECLMYNTMDAWGTDRWVSLQNAISSENINIIQDHTAIGDCNLCLELIKTFN